jgi:hypothetical protein
MTKAENKLTASYNFNGDPVEIEEKEGLTEAIKEVQETKERLYVPQEDRVVDYEVYWNEKTDAVRFAALVAGATYEVPDEFFEQQKISEVSDD